MGEQDSHFLHKAFLQAALAVGGSDPNPPVGAILVSPEGKIIGQGFTQKAGGPHAEVMAIRQAQSRGGLCEGTTLYVTLEPCNHYGRTPPCTLAILEAGISRVVTAALDPSVPMQGQSLKLLEQQGVATALISQHFSLERHLTLMPFFYRQRHQEVPIILKWAQTSDGYLAPPKGSSGPITSEKSRSILQRLRRLYPVLGIGAGTWQSDLPQLSRRYYRNFFFERKDLHGDLYLRELILRHESKEDIPPEAYEGDYYRFFVLPKSLNPELLRLHAQKLEKNHVVYFVYRENASLVSCATQEIVFFENYEDLWEKLLAKAKDLGAGSIFWEAGPTLAEKLLSDQRVQAMFVFTGRRKAQELWGQKGRGFAATELFAQGCREAFEKYGFFWRAFLQWEQEELHYFTRADFWD
ncbi:MAG: bifunctional diaminohydroxyphosphoribosylaminopyrimidine deaminase/5-amino-6-(5-phosphoribosylamino)uracil reductase RibD [Leptospiraceae bacterium]|nr:bifunctional diaminohydroxyphosphoribosylaminopyrimidine deaminase/5-amino-6-(5-phosphoribosylamino)uracil reductase RibD [Leptospiraceae bacterium]MDW8306243.1 bifunctional diaminohydroxyphosphoribosylaminopyrimidine deaminase/5-amino-6-(5-phosphoribosylamino)uracil reductase RibD [Leptospiraceae bacterium]